MHVPPEYMQSILSCKPCDIRLCSCTLLPQVEVLAPRWIEYQLQPEEYWYVPTDTSIRSCDIRLCLHTSAAG
jgi:hypothetical protein